MAVSDASSNKACAASFMEQKSSLVERLPLVLTVWTTIDGVNDSEGLTEGVELGDILGVLLGIDDG